jgi:MATE family multidrug resistance protein
VTNLALDYLLIFGPGPFPRLGAFGDGLATTISWGLGVVCMLVAARKFRLVALLSNAIPSRPPDFVTSIPKLTWPAIVSAAIDYSSTVIFFVILGGLSSIALAGGRIDFEVLVLLFAIGSAFAAAIRILIGRATGQEQPNEARSIWRTGQRILLVPSILIGLVLIIFPLQTVGLFASFTPVIRAASRAMPLVGLCVPLMAWTMGNTSLMRACGKTQWDMYGNLVAAIFVQLPVGWLLADVAGLGVAGAYCGVLAYWLCRMSMTEVLARLAWKREV